ncbi:transposon Ty3-G Gag-Pol polyprotein [Trichonephila clavipes]|nr:transposon Ty3-G Gag-Pol polyprotein [Trichonephila clavipes]
MSTCVMGAFRSPAPLQFSLGNVNEKWRKWRQELENYLLATEKDDRTDKIKIAILLNLLGREGLEIYNTFKLESKANFSEALQKNLKNIAHHDRMLLMSVINFFHVSNWRAKQLRPMSLS